MTSTHIASRAALALLVGLAPLVALAAGGAHLAHASVLALAAGIFRATLGLGRGPSAETSGSRRARTSAA